MAVVEQHTVEELVQKCGWPYDAMDEYDQADMLRLLTEAVAVRRAAPDKENARRLYEAIGQLADKIVEGFNAFLAGYSVERPKNVHPRFVRSIIEELDQFLGDERCPAFLKRRLQEVRRRARALLVAHNVYRARVWVKDVEQCLTQAEEVCTGSAPVTRESVQLVRTAARVPEAVGGLRRYIRYEGLPKFLEKERPGQAAGELLASFCDRASKLEAQLSALQEQACQTERTEREKRDEEARKAEARLVTKTREDVLEAIVKRNPEARRLVDGYVAHQHVGNAGGMRTAMYAIARIDGGYPPFMEKEWAEALRKQE